MFVTIYGRSGCAYCVKAKNYCKVNGIKYCYLPYNDETKEVLQKELETLPRTLPIVFVNDTFIGGYNELEQYFK